MNSKEFAWLNEDKLPNEMVRAALGLNGWPRLEMTNHFKYLREMIDLCDANSIADIGCGAAELGRVCSNHDYTGFDLPHIIEKVAKVVNPNLNYVHFSAYESDYSIFKQYDLLVCNSFLSELDEPLTVLERLLENTEKYLIIHRQHFSDSDEIKEYTTYANLKTIRSFISTESFNNLLHKHEILKRITSEYGDTILIKKTDKDVCREE